MKQIIIFLSLVFRTLPPIGRIPPALAWQYAGIFSTPQVRVQLSKCDSSTPLFINQVAAHENPVTFQ